MALLALLLALGPWDLRCPSMPAAVQPAARAFVPWAGPGAQRALHAGPVWLHALSSHTAISRDGDDTDPQGYYLHRALIAVAPSHRGAVTLTGARLGKPVVRGRLGFERDAPPCDVAGDVVSCGVPSHRWTSALHVPAGSGWRLVGTMLRIGRTGCFHITAAGARLRVSLPLAVPGPDWGTPGW
ncbi:MAG TPA: hypothetical protein VEH55_02475 [Gaiellaceae bacterium]|nr:hypothetical protein [Gaiellaceae bacterium]